MKDFSFQLYSARNFPPLENNLAMVKRLGYTQVEGFGGLYADVDGLAASLKAHGLAHPTGHFGLDQLKDTSNALRIAEKLGVKKIFCPYLAPQDRSADDSKWIELAETLGKLGEVFNREGYGFGWHNHDFEFVATTDGHLPIDLILETAPNLEWEADVAWIVRGKADPIAWFDKYGKRITAVHVKDIAPAGENANEDGWADVGFGTLGWDNLIKEVMARTAAQYFVAEHDNPSDIERFASRSIATASKWA